jgi:hypothetical protein
MQFRNPGHDQERIQVCSGCPVGPLGLELLGALEVDDCAISVHAGVEVLVDKVARKTETGLVERQRALQALDQELWGCSGCRGHGMPPEGVAPK